VLALQRIPEELLLHAAEAVGHVAVG
jgi:hypothetical protein